MPSHAHTTPITPPSRGSLALLVLRLPSNLNLMPKRKGGGLGKGGGTVTGKGGGVKRGGGKGGGGGGGGGDGDGWDDDSDSGEVAVPSLAASTLVAPTDGSVG